MPTRRPPGRGPDGAGRPSARRFSSPVSRSSTAENSPVTPIAARTPSGSATSVVAGRPPRSGRPSAAISVERILIIVVLPAPLGPSRAKIVPSATVRSMPSSTTRCRRMTCAARLTVIAGPLPHDHPSSLLVALGGEFTRGAQRVTMGYPLLVQQRDPLLPGSRRTRSSPAASPAARWGAPATTSRPSRAKAPSSWYSVMSNPRASGDVKSRRTRSIRSPADRVRRIACVGLQRPSPRR